MRRDLTEHEHLVMHELARQAGTDPTPDTVGAAIDLDAREMVDALTELFGRGLAKEVDKPDGISSDMYTLEPIELTTTGRRLHFG